MAERDSWAVQASGPTGMLDVEETRFAIGALVMPHTSAIKAKSGFRPGPTSPGLVTATGTPDGFVHVAAFQLFIQGGRATAPGVYITGLDATKDINILSTPADPTNPRNDLIVAQQSDTFYGDGTSPFEVRHVVGTPAGSPSDPSVSGSGDYVALARVRVDAAATTIVSAKITDLRTTGHAKSLVGGLFSVALGGILPVASQAQQDALTGTYDGLKIWRTDLKAWMTHDGTGWRRWDTQWNSFSPTWTSTGTAPALGNGTLTGEYMYRGRELVYQGRLLAGSSTTFGTGEWRMSVPVNAASINHACGSAFYHDFGTTYWPGVCAMQPGVDKLNFVGSASGQVANNVPFTWAVSDQLIWNITYPIA